MNSPDHCEDNNCSSCGCTHDHKKESILPILIRTIIAGFFVIIAILSEQGIISLPYVGIGSSVIALLLTAGQILKEAVYGLIKGERNVCELASIAIVAAVIIGEFTAAAEVALILTIGELAEGYAYARSKRDIEGIITRNPRFGYVMHDADIVQVPVAEIVVGDRVMVRSGDIVPVDGTVLEGKSCLDESCLTGESQPIEKTKGNQVFSGSINLEGTLIITADRLSDDSTYSHIVNLVSEAGKRRPPSYPFIDRFARIYSPFMLLIAGIVLLLTGSVLRAITVLIVACPCALLLATPSAVLATIGSAAKKGILMKSGEFLEVCRHITVMVMDKTGTLTSGMMHLSAVIPVADYTSREILEYAAACECSSSHPVARAIIRAAEEEGIPITCGGNTRQYSGLGIEDHQNGKIIHVGNLQFMHEQMISLPNHPDISNDTSDGHILVLVAVDKKIIGVIRITDIIRSESVSVIHRLKDMGIGRIEILTGDNHQVATRIAAQCKISSDFVHSGMYPEDKEKFVADLQKNGEVVCFVGDGTNDGPALARSDLGVSIGSREDTVALETSGVILMQGGLSSLPEFISLGRRTSRIIMMNVALALALNFVMICGAAAGLLSPAIGAIGHQVATVAVLINSARLAYAPEKNAHSDHTGTCGCDVCKTVIKEVSGV